MSAETPQWVQILIGVLPVIAFWSGWFLGCAEGRSREKHEQRIRAICLVFGHRPVIRWYWNGRSIRINSHRKAKVMARAECSRCGAAFGNYSAPPR